MQKLDRFNNNLKAISFLIAVAAIIFLPILVQGNLRILSSIEGDTWSQFFYWRRFAFDSLVRGEIPLWNPYNFSGQPFVGAMQSAIFYPLNLFFLIFDTPFAINLTIGIHCLGTSVFTYFFARYIGISPFGGVLSAVAFAYGGPYFIHIYPGHLPHLAAMWMPLIFLAMEAFLRHQEMKYAVWAGVCLGLELLAGYPQYPFYSAVAVSIYFLIHLTLRKAPKRFSRDLVGFGIFLVTAGLLAAIQLVPAWEMVRQSARGNVTFEWISLYSLPPENLLTLLIPNFFGDIVNVPYWGKNNLWEMSVYLGLVPLMMMVLALTFDRRRQVLVFAVIAGAFLLMALGKHTPLFWFLYTFVPGFGLFRGVGKAAFVFAFAGSLLAGFGFDMVRDMIARENQKLPFIASLLAASAVLIAVVAFISPAGEIHSWRALVRAYAATEEHFDPLPLNEEFFRASLKLFWADVAKLVIVSFAFGALCLVGRKAWRRSSEVIAALLLVLAVADLWHFGSRFLVSFEPRILSLDPELKKYLKTEVQPFRVAAPLAPLRNHLLNVGMLEGIENVGGYDAIVLKNYNEFINFTQGLPLDQPNLLMGINRIAPLLNLLNVKYYILDPSIELNLAGFELAFHNTRNKVYRSRNVLPRSFIVHRAITGRNLEATFQHLMAPAFDPGAVAVVNEALDGFSQTSRYRSPVPQVVKHTPMHVVIDGYALAPGLLVLADSYYPGWKAFVDGSETKIYRPNHVMRAVFLPAGRHRVEFRYEPLSFKIGVAITGATVVLLLVFFIVAFYGGVVSS